MIYCTQRQLIQEMAQCEQTADECEFYAVCEAMRAIINPPQAKKADPKAKKK
jgi:hypothetical protein